MKKIFSILLMLLIGIAGISCNNQDEYSATLEPLVELSEDFLIGAETNGMVKKSLSIQDSIIEASSQGIELEMIEYEHPLFFATITNIRFNIVNRTITFDFDIRYPNQNQTEYYFAITNTLINDTKTVRLYSDDLYSTNNFTIEMVSATDYFIEVEMGMAYTANYTFSVREETFSVGFRYKVLENSRRDYIEGSDIFLVEIDGDYYHGQVCGAIQDPDNIIDLIKIEIIDPVTNHLVNEIILDDIISIRNEEGRIFIDWQLISDLTPSSLYIANLYVSGNDGVFDFTNVLIDSNSSSIDGPYISSYHPFHGFYAYVYSIERAEDILDLDLEIFNQGIFQIDGKTPELYLNFYRNTYDLEPYFSILLEEYSRQHVLFTNTLMSSYDTIRIEDKDRNYILYEKELARVLVQDTLF